MTFPLLGGPPRYCQPLMSAVKLVAWSLLALFAAALAPAEEIAGPTGLSADSTRAETIYERDDTGRVRVQREVRLNEQGDYVNHGVWRAWGPAGELVGQGRYAWGKPTGAWTRWADAADVAPLGEDVFQGFTGPFLSQATYRDGRLERVWSIFDADGKLVSEVAFHHGQRHGEAVLWGSDGAIRRRARYSEGLPAGTLEERDATGGLEIVQEFVEGRPRREHVEHYESGQLKCREEWLGALQRQAAPDDPWKLQLARYEPTGEELRDGLREAWWPNGQPKLRAEYRLGQAIGQARWWHENGQLALQGDYEEGLAAGSWSWWRENGVRAAACQYQQGVPVGELSQWAADGRRMRSESPERLTRRPDTSLIR
ncbi:toxin-antitoxin system YwqK family antitoxin [Botrimarina colliarenosi]|nr:hypothetical protein [Botrimarina colliarenosi]